ncbi:Long chronological lifespan protein 2 [Saitozyma podzolica]|uniref:Long chronological lifespan protein 2 n=1 Tax=Saitozyma podzolica TaxID=1890683 RepID=A0A427XYB2_9TREE|nr:Long chronological lifespan protein 2 [Saitozyma podzolica]
MLPRPLLTLVTLLLLPLTLAQFGNFFQGGFPFGGGHFQGNQQDAPKSPGRQHKGWTEMESVHCRAGYVCPGSLTCVPTPADCPCPYPEDVKCVLPDDRPRDEGEGPPFVCVRGQQECERVKVFAKPI